MASALRIFLFSLCIGLLPRSSLGVATSKCKAFGNSTEGSRATAPAPIGDALPPMPERPKWTSLFPGILVSPIRTVDAHLAQRRNAQAYWSQLVLLSRARHQAIQALGEADAKHPSLARLINAKRTAIESTTSIEQIQMIRDSFEKEAQIIREREETRDAEFSEYKFYSDQVLNAFRSEVRAVVKHASARDPLLASIDAAEQKIKSRPNARYASGQLHLLSSHIHESIDAYTNTEKVRIEVERRAEPQSPESTVEILKSFRDVALESGVKQSELVVMQDQQAVLFLQRFHAIRSFIYREMQTARRYLIDNRLPIESEGIQKRLRNVSTAFRGSLEIENPKAILNLMKLRDAVQILIQPNTYEGLYSMRKPSLIAREKLVAMALKDPVIAATVMDASVSIQTPRVPIPPHLPAVKEPTPPKAPTVPSRSARDWKSYQTNYPAYVNRFREYQQSVELYNAQIAENHKRAQSYRADVLRYEEQRLQSQAALDNQYRARQAIQLFFAVHSPTSFNVSTEAIVAHYDSRIALGQTRQANAERSRAERKNNEPSNDSSGGDAWIFAQPLRSDDGGAPVTLPYMPIPETPSVPALMPIPPLPTPAEAPTDVQDAIDNGTESDFDGGSGGDGDGGDGGGGGGD